MATVLWTGNAAARAQVSQVEFPGKAKVGEQFSLVCNGKTLTYTATTSRIADVMSGLADLVGQYNNEIPEFAELSAAADGDRLILTGPTDGADFTVTAKRGDPNPASIEVVQLQQGYAGVNEVQRVSLVGTVTGGTFTLSYRGQTTGALAYNASAATIQTALTGLSTIGTGNVTVSGSGPWDVTWTGSFAYATPDMITANGGSLTKAGAYPVRVAQLLGARAGKNRIYRISSASGGNASSNVSVMFNGAAVGPWAGDDDAATVQTTFDGVFGANNSIVTRPAAGVWEVEFTGKYANVNAPELGATSTGLGSTSLVAAAEVKREQAGQSTTNTEWSFTPPTYGAYSITWVDPRDGRRRGSSLIPYDATAAEIQQAIGDIYETTTGALVASVVADSGDPADRKGPFRIVFTGPLAGEDIDDFTATAGTLTKVTDGNTDEIKEIQTLRIRPYPTGGTFRLQWGGYTFPGGGGSFNATDTAATIQTGINAVLSIVSVTEGDVVYQRERCLRFEFWGVTTPGPKELLKFVQMTTLTSPFAMVETVQEATEPICEEQLVSLGNAPGGGTFTLTYGTQTTSAITFNAEATEVEAALSTAVTAGYSETNAVQVTGPAAGPWRVRFSGTLAGRNALSLTGDGTSLSGSKVAVSRTVDAESPENERQTVTLRGAPTGGTFTLTFDAQTTGSLPHNASAAVVQAALEALSSVGYGNVYVTAERAGGPYVVEFIGALAAANQSAISGTSSLTGAGLSGNVARLVAPTGPNWASEPLNYAGGALPTNSDALVFENGSVSLKYGLEDLAAVTLAELHIRQSYTAESLGLPTHTGEYQQYRPLAFKIKATKVYVGAGDGIGCPLVRLNTGTAATDVMVVATGQPSGDLPAFNWVGDNASNVARIFRGSVGLINVAGQTGTLADLQIGYVDSQETDADVVVGVGAVTLSTVKQIGGTLQLWANATTATLTGGELEVMGSAAVSTLRVSDGQAYYSATGSMLQAYIGAKGSLLFTRDMRPRSIQGCEIAAGATIRDPNRSVTWNTPIGLRDCGIQDVELDLGSHISLAVSNGP